MFNRERTVTIVCFTDIDLGSEIKSKFSLPKSMKHTVGSVFNSCLSYGIKIQEHTPSTFYINLYLTPLGQVMQFIETCGT